MLTDGAHAQLCACGPVARVTQLSGAADEPDGTPEGAARRGASSELAWVVALK